MDSTFRKLSPKEKAMVRAIDRKDIQKLRELLQSVLVQRELESGLSGVSYKRRV